MTTLVMVFVAIATALVASAQQASCPGKGKDELEGASLVMRESHISKVSSITDDDTDMEEEDFDEDLTDEEGAEGSTCPKWCTKGRRLKNKPWSKKCCAGALLMQEQHQDASVKTITRDLSE